MERTTTPGHPTVPAIDPVTAAELIRLVEQLRHRLLHQLDEAFRPLLAFIERNRTADTAAGGPSEGYPTPGAVSSIRPAKEAGTALHEDTAGIAGSLS